MKTDSRGRGIGGLLGATANQGREETGACLKFSHNAPNWARFLSRRAWGGAGECVRLKGNIFIVCRDCARNAKPEDVRAGGWRSGRGLGVLEGKGREVECWFYCFVSFLYLSIKDLIIVVVLNSCFNYTIKRFLIFLHTFFRVHCVVSFYPWHESP